MEKLLEKFKLNSKKGIENLVIFLVLVIIVMVVINSLFNEKENKIVTTSNVDVTSKGNNTLEEKLENILSTISGVGKVKVMISYANSIEKVPIYDTKEVTLVLKVAGQELRHSIPENGKVPYKV